MKFINYHTTLLVSLLLQIAMLIYSSVTAILPMTILTVLSIVLSLLIQFLIHHQTLQLRLCIYDAIILVALQIWIVLSFPTINLSDIFPAICAILTALAAIFIRRGIVSADIKRILNKYRHKKGKK